jgi:hypothetical protein
MLKIKFRKQWSRRGGFLLLTILSRPPPVKPVRGTGQTGVGLGSGSLLEQLPINSHLCTFISCDLRFSLRGRNNGVLHRVGLRGL